MKACLVVIASLSISPAYAFENLIVDSAFQHPVVLTGNVQSSGWTNVTSSPSVPLNSRSIGGIVAAATTVIVAVPNPFVGASAANVGSATNLPGNLGSQLVTTTANVSPKSPNVSQPSLAAPSAVAAFNSPNVAPAAPAVAAAVPNPFVGASAGGSTTNLPGNSGSQLVTTTFNVPRITSNNLGGPGPSGTAGANVSRKTNEVGNVSLAGKIQGGSAGTTNGAGGGGGAGNANGGGGEKGSGGGGGAGRASGGTFNIADVFSGDNSGKAGGGAGSMNRGASHGVPGPEAGTGLPILILVGCIAYVVMKRRMHAAGPDRAG